MKKMKMRQMMLTLLGGLTCGVRIMGCYPLVPAYFAALYLEEVNGMWLAAVMYIGMMYSMPLPVLVKYSVALIVTAGAIRLVRWANDGCPAALGGALASLTTMILSFCGGLLAWKNQPDMPAVFLEGIFILGAAILLNRMLHTIMEWKWEPAGAETLPKSAGNEGRLLNYAESFQGLSQVFKSMSVKKSSYSPEELGKMQNELTGKLCANCDSCAICWERDSAPLYGILSRMISSILNSGVPEEENRAELEKYCKKSRDMVEEALHVFERVKLNRAWYNRLLENRQTIAEQLNAMAYIMQDCAREERLLDAEEKKGLAELRYRAKEHGIVIDEMHLYQTVQGHWKLSVRMHSRSGGCISIKSFQSAIGCAFRKELRLQADCKSFISKEAADFLFFEDTKYRSVQGITRLKKDGAQISGDNFSLLELDSGSYLMGLSDGMGSGSTACKESEMVLDLVERFTEAGFSIETAIRMMNSAMVMKGENDLFSTVDLCSIDLYNGAAEFYKIGAAASFIKRGKNVSCYSSESLPVGVGTNPEIERQQAELKNGDFVVMVTDGVLEYLHVPKPEETMQEIIESIDTNHPGILVKKIMERVMLFTGGRVQDDMTILATCIWEK